MLGVIAVGVRMKKKIIERTFIKKLHTLDAI